MDNCVCGSYYISHRLCEHVLCIGRYVSQIFVPAMPIAETVIVIKDFWYMIIANNIFHQIFVAS
jgi:hypothetical protein